MPIGHWLKNKGTLVGLVRPRASSYDSGMVLEDPGLERFLLRTLRLDVSGDRGMTLIWEPFGEHDLRGSLCLPTSFEGVPCQMYLAIFRGYNMNP